MKRDFCLKLKKGDAMKLDDLALLMGKTRRQLEEELKKSDIIELKLAEVNSREENDEGNIIILR